MTPAEIIKADYDEVLKAADILVDMYSHRGQGSLLAMFSLGAIDYETFRAASNDLRALTVSLIAKYRA